MGDTCIVIREQTDAAGARRAALSLATALAFDEVSAGKLGLVVTEAAKNLLKHAGGGQVVLRCLEYDGTAGIELLALDKGPGIANLGRCYEDGFSTAGTPGNGLGAIARLSTVHEILLAARAGHRADGAGLETRTGRRDAANSAAAVQRGRGLRRDAGRTGVRRRLDFSGTRA